MKHLIIVNPSSGKEEAKQNLQEEIERCFKGLDYEVHESTGPKEITSFLKEYFAKEKELTRVYACGGDGTVCEAVNALVGVKNAELAINPLGTGNDFVKIYGVSNEEVDQFRNFESLINGKPVEVDLSKISGESLPEPMYSINVINFGFDAIVGAKGNENKLKGKKAPYGFKNAILPALLRGRFNKIIVCADGEQLDEKKLLLASLSQGQWVGGEYHASPKSDNTDGLIDVVIMKTMSLFRLLFQYFNKYKAGEHLTNEKLLKRIVYRQAKEITIDAPEDIDICVDGEIIKGKKFKVEVMPKAIKLVPPGRKE